MKLLSIPRDGNPYQENLYREMRAQGVEVEYLGELTLSATLNWLLLPLELLIRRRRGWSLIHVHWLYPFAAPLSDRSHALRRLSTLWLRLWLRVAKNRGMKIVWTAHNTLPHAPIFGDDIAARRRLVDATTLVIAHSEEALDDVTSVIGRPPASAIVPHGTFVDPEETAGLRRPGSGKGIREVLFFGRMLEYKGLDELTEVVSQLDPDVPLRVRVVGPCPDADLEDRMNQRAQGISDRLSVECGFIDDEDLPAMFAQADAVVLPFRRITTSSSAEIALNYGRPLVIPDLPALASLPDAAVFRYPPGREGLREALIHLSTADPATLHEMSLAALESSRGRGWAKVAARTRELLAMAVHGEIGPAGELPSASKSPRSMMER